MICGCEMEQEYSPDTMAGTLGGKPYKLHICSKQECWKKAWKKIRADFGVIPKEEAEE